MCKYVVPDRAATDFINIPSFEHVTALTLARCNVLYIVLGYYAVARLCSLPPFYIFS